MRLHQHRISPTHRPSSRAELKSSEKPVAGAVSAQDEAFLEFVRKMPSEQELSAPDSQESELVESIEGAVAMKKRLNYTFNLRNSEEIGSFNRRLR